jgi:hypothetical protein
MGKIGRDWHHGQSYDQVQNLPEIVIEIYIRMHLFVKAKTSSRRTSSMGSKGQPWLQAAFTVASAAVFLPLFMTIALTYVGCRMFLLVMKAVAQCSALVGLMISKSTSASWAVQTIPTAIWNAFDFFAAITVETTTSSMWILSKFSCDLCCRILKITTSTAIEISVLMIFSALDPSFTPTAISGLLRVIGSSLILQLPINAVFFVLAILSGLLVAVVAILSSVIAASVMIAACFWVVSTTIFLALGICTTAPKPDHGERCPPWYLIAHHIIVNTAVQHASLLFTSLHSQIAKMNAVGCCSSCTLGTEAHTHARIWRRGLCGGCSNLIEVRSPSLFQLPPSGLLCQQNAKEAVVTQDENLAGSFCRVADINKDVFLRAGLCGIP